MNHTDKYPNYGDHHPKKAVCPHCGYAQRWPSSRSYICPRCDDSFDALISFEDFMERTHWRFNYMEW